MLYLFPHSTYKQNLIQLLIFNTHIFGSKIFRETILRHQRVEAECWLPFDSPLLDVGGVLPVLGVASRES